MSGIEDDGEKVWVEAYMLKKISIYLSLRPIPVVHKWHHLFDLQLADSDFKTPACIDLLQGLKYPRAYFVTAGRQDIEACQQQLILALDGCSLVKFKVAIWLMWQTSF